jgi:putative DNA primase/helicase
MAQLFAAIEMEITEEMLLNPGFDIRRILKALDTAGWIVEHDADRRSKKTKVSGSSISLYAIRPTEES